MSSSSVWVQLYYEGKDEPKGQPIKIKPAPEDVAELIKEVKKEELKKELGHAGLTEIFVHPPNSKPPFSQDKALKAWDPTPSNSSGPQPLIVVAPAPKKEPSDTGIEDIKQLAAFARKEMASKSQDMSKASTQFAQDLVDGLGISVQLEKENREAGDIEEAPAYSWTRKTTEGDTVKIGEVQGTPGAKNWFHTHFLSRDLEQEGYVCTVVTGHRLPKLTVGGLSASGEADMVIGNKISMQYADSVYEQAVGLIELKTDGHSIKVGQMILELTAFSRISRFGQGAVLLASDCNKQWRLLWFQAYNKICRRSYASGRKCWMDFREMIRKAEERSAAMVPPKKKRLTVVNEDETEEMNEQDLEGFGGFEDDAKQKAVENEAMLHQLSNFLGSLYGERPVVPAWAQAKNVCPDYYM